jgi:hypothetical protein
MQNKVVTWLIGASVHKGRTAIFFICSAFIVIARLIHYGHHFSIILTVYDALEHGIRQMSPKDTNPRFANQDSIVIY